MKILTLEEAFDDVNIEETERAFQNAEADGLQDGFALKTIRENLTSFETRYNFSQMSPAITDVVLQ